MIVTQTRLENIANGYLDPEKLNEPFVILRNFVSLRKTRRDEEKRGAWCYSLVWGNEMTTDGEIPKSIELDPALARKLIKLYTMKIALSTEDGQVYEKDGKPYKKKFNSCKIKKNRNAFALHDAQ